MVVTPSLGLINGADVKLTKVDGTQLGLTVKTDATGKATVTFSGHSGPVIVEVAGNATATYFDESLGSTAAFTAGEKLRTVLDSVKSQVGVTPLTEIAYQRAEAVAGTAASLTTTAIQTANETIRQALASEIADITAPPTMVSASTTSGSLDASDASKYAAKLAALAKMAQATGGVTVTNPALAIAKQLAADLKDGLLDGKMNGSTPVTGTATYTVASLATDLKAQIASYAAACGTTALQTLAAGSTLSTVVTDLSKVTVGSGSTGGSSGGTTGGSTGGSSTGGSTSGAVSAPLTTASSYTLGYAGIVNGGSASSDGFDVRTASITIGSSGQMTGYINTLNDFTKTNEALTLGTASVNDLGGKADVTWGRWNSGQLGGKFFETSLTPALTANQGFHYVVGNNTTTVPATGKITYSTIIGSTSPTLNGPTTTAPGSIIAASSSVVADFASSKWGFDISLSYGGSTYRFQSTGGVSNVATGPTYYTSIGYAGGPASVTMDGAAVTSANAYGYLIPYGANARYMALLYSANNKGPAGIVVFDKGN